MIIKVYKHSLIEWAVHVKQGYMIFVGCYVIKGRLVSNKLQKIVSRPHNTK